jgi:hypothetical protein
MAGTIKSNIRNCTESAIVNYSTSGVPFTTASVFSKTFTADNDFVFKTPPTVDFTKTNSPSNYSFEVVDVPANGVQNKNLTQRTFTIKYTYELTQPENDVVKFFARGKRTITSTTQSIYGFSINKSSLKQVGETRDLVVFGDTGAIVNLAIAKVGGANLITTTAAVKTTTSNSVLLTTTVANNRVFVGMSVDGTGVGSGVTVVAVSGSSITLSAAKSLSANTILTFGSSGGFTATIGDNGKYILPINFPRVSSASSYTVTLTEITSDSFVNITTPSVVTIPQYVNVALTLQESQSGSSFIIGGDNKTFTVAGNTIKSIEKEFSFTATSNSVLGQNHLGTAVTIPLKTLNRPSTATLPESGVFTASDFSGVTAISNKAARSAKGADLFFTDLSITIQQGTSRTTSDTTSGANVVLSSANTAIKPGMKVIGSGITNSVTVSSISNTSLVLSGAPGGTISEGTTLYFNPIATAVGVATLNSSAVADETIGLLFDNIIKVNEPFTSAGIASVSVNSNEAVSITLPDAQQPTGAYEFDDPTYIITQLPQTVSGNSANGTLKYIVEGTSTNITQVNTPLPAGLKIVHYTRSLDSTQQTDFKFKVNDGHQDSAEYTVIMNLS